MKHLYAAQTGLTAFFASQPGMLLAKWGRRVLLAGVLAFLVYQLSGVGWAQVARSLPTNPLFYVICLVLSCNQPFFYALAYRASWKFRFPQGFAALFKMCVYNNDVIGNSGEVYLFLWANKRLGLSRLAILRTVKDNTVLHCIWDSTVTFCLPALFLLCGQLELGERFGRIDTLVQWAPLAVVAAWIMLLALRHRVLSFTDRQLAQVSAVHASRLLVVNALVILQWSTAMPGPPLYAWCTLLALRNLVGAIPMLPSNDLLFVGAGVQLAEHLGVEAAPFAAMLLMTSGVWKLLNFLLFSTFTVLETDGTPRPVAERQVVGEQVSVGIGD